jgi:hypothetical protein
VSADVPLGIAMVGLAHVTFCIGRRQHPVPGLVVKSLFDEVEGRAGWPEFREWMGTELTALGGRSPAACIARGCGSVERVRRHLETAFPRRRRHGRWRTMSREVEE